MSQQGSLRFDRTELLESLWTGLPAQAREQVVVLFAGLIARSTRGKVGWSAQPLASVSQRLVGRAAPERVNAALGSEASREGITRGRTRLARSIDRGPDTHRPERDVDS